MADHMKSKLHKNAMTNISCLRKTAGEFFVQNAASKKNIDKAHMKILLFATVHNLAFENIPHLVRIIQSACPDSEIAKHLSFGRLSAQYHLVYGLGKTVKNELVKEFIEIFCFWYIIFAFTLISLLLIIKRSFRY